MAHTRDLGFIKAFGNHLKKLRLAKDLSQKELSYKCGISTSRIGILERGKLNPSLNTLRLLAQGLGEETKVLLDFKYKRKGAINWLHKTWKPKYEWSTKATFDQSATWELFAIQNIEFGIVKIAPGLV